MNTNERNRPGAPDCVWESYLDILLKRTDAVLWEYYLDNQTTVPLKGSMGRIHPDSQKDMEEAHQRLLKGESAVDCTVLMKHEDIGYCWIYITYTRLPDTGWSEKKAVAVALPVTGRYERENRYFKEEQMRALMSKDMIAVGKVNLTRNRVDYLWGTTLKPDMPSKVKNYQQMFRLGVRSFSEEDEKKRYLDMFSYPALFCAFDNGITNLNMEYHYHDMEGHIFWALSSALLLRDPGSGDLIFFSFIQNIDNRKKMELQLLSRVERDKVTGLYNKSTMESMVRSSIKSMRENYGSCVMLIINIDDFKEFNERLGHPYGDFILSETAHALEMTFPNDTVIGRTEGDEFAVYLADVISEDWVSQKAEELRSSLVRIQPDLPEFSPLTVSIGISFGGRTSVLYEQLYEQARYAVYEAKNQGKNQYHIYKKGVTDSIHFQRVDSSCLAEDMMNSNCMLDELEELIFIIDFNTYELLYMNRSAENAFGSLDGENQGKRCYEVIQGFKTPCSFCKHHIPDEDRFQSWENVNARLEKHFIIKDKIKQWRGRKVRFELFIELEGSSMIYNKTTESLLFDSVRILLSNTDLSDALQSVMKNVCGFYKADRSYLLEIDMEKLRGSILFEHVSAQAEPIIGEAQDIDMTKLPKWLDALKKDEALVVNNMKEEDSVNIEEYKLKKGYEVSSFYRVPFSIQGQCSGYIGVDNPSLHLGDLAFLRYIAYLAGAEFSKRQMDDRKNYLEYHDGLTGLWNLAKYQEHILKFNEYVLSSLGVVSADINGLKLFNQKYGHSAGDQVVKKIAGILVEAFGQDSVFRLAGDEFIILYQNVTNEAFLKKLAQLNEDLNQAYSEGVSLGQVWADTDIDIERLVRQADEILIIYKNDHYQKMKQPTYYTESYQVKEVLDAIENREYAVFLQPKAHVGTKLIMGAEALVRYIDKEGNIILPARFVPFLETQKLIHHIDYFVYEEVCWLLRNWMDRGYDIFPISFNISRATLLQSDLLKRLDQISDKYQLPRRFLEVEITESYGEIGPETMKDICDQIVNHGYRLSLDDFGANYSNMSALSSLKLDVLKLDKSVVNNLYSNYKVAVVAENLIKICHELDIKCVAEGVETEEQLEILEQLECDYVQGYLLNKPIPAADFEVSYLLG